jgi:hypothetical protein
MSKHQISGRLVRAGVVTLSGLWIVLITTGTAHAYLDPGAGSMLLQVLLGGAAGAAVIGKLYWHRFLTLIGARKEPQPQADQRSHDQSRD